MNAEGDKYEKEWNTLHNLITGDISQPMSTLERLHQIETLLKSGRFDVNRLTSSSKNLLHLLCLRPLNKWQSDYDKNYEIAKLLINNGVDINQKDERGKTPLMLACQNGYMSVVYALVTLEWKHLDVNARDSSGESAFTIAGRNVDYYIYERLITTLFWKAVDTGDMKTVTRFRNSSIEECAIRLDDLCLRSIKCRFPIDLHVFKLEYGEKFVNSLDFERPIKSCINFYAWFYAILIADNSRNKSMLKLLFDFETIVRGTTRSGLSALHLVLYRCKNYYRLYRVFEILVASGRFDVNALTNDKETVLHVACRCRDPKNIETTIELLIRNKVNVNQRNSFGQTALMIACENENVVAVRKLLKWKNAKGEKCDINVKDKYRKTALTFAYQSTNAEVAEMIEQALLINAIENGDLETIERVFVEECVEECDDQEPNVKKMKMGFETEGNILDKEWNILQRLVAGNLSQQIKSKEVDLVTIFLKSEKFDVNTLTSYSQNLLHLICLRHLNKLHCDLKENYEIAKLLLENGVDFNHKDQTGRTPLMLACENGYDSVVKALLDWNSTALDIDARDNSGETALTMAARNKNMTFSRHSSELFLHYVKRNDIKGAARFVNSSRSACTICVKDLCVHQIAIRFTSHSIWLEAVYMAHCKSIEENSCTDILKLLLNYELYMHEPNEKGQTILHSAVEEYLENKCEPKGLRKIEILLNSSKCDVNALNSQKETVLHLVCSAKANENLLLDDLLKILLEYRVDLNLRNNSEKTALLIACENGNTNIVRNLLTLTRNNDIYRDVDAYDKPETDATVNSNKLFGEMNRVSNLKSGGEKKKWRQTYSFDFKTWKDAAYVAIENSFEEILELLLDYDVVVQRQYDNDGDTILTQCIFDEAPSANVSLKLCKKLLESGKVNVSALEFSSMTTLHEVLTRALPAYDNHDIQDLITLLLRHKINVNQKNYKGNTVLAFDRSFNFIRDILEFVRSLNVILDILNFAKTTGTCLDINSRDAFFRTALIWAAIWKVSDAVEMILNAGASVNLADNRGFTALHHALYEVMSPETWINYGNFPSNIQELRQRKAIDVILYETEPHEDYNRNAKELDEEKLKIVELLFKRGVDVNALDNEGHSPLDIAVATSPEISSHIKEALKAKGAILNVFQNKEDSVSQANLNVNANPLHRRANLLKFCTKQRKELKELYMITAEKDKMAIANVSKLSAIIQAQLISAKDQKGRTPLHRAIISGQTISHENTIIKSEVMKTVKLLISLGCNVNETDIYGRTPLHYVDFKELKNLLISRGADQTAKDENEIEAIEMSKLLVATAVNGRDRVSRIIQEIRKCIKEPKSTYLQRGKIEMELVKIEKNTKFNPETIPKLVWKKGNYAFRHPSVNQFRDEVTKFIENLATEITKRDWRFVVEPIFVGSSNEETKTDLPDEFDFLFVLKKISQLCEVTFSPELPSGFVRLKRKNSENNSMTDTDFDCFFDNNSILIIEKLKAQFQIILRKVLSDAQFIENHQNFDWDLDLQTDGLYFLNTTRYYELANTLNLRNMKLDLESRNVFHISIDIVPCIHIDDWWPDEAISKVSEEIKAVGCNLVFVQPQRLYPWVPFLESCVKISFARAESETIKRSSDVAKQAFMIAKQLITKSGCGTSYILKNSCLSCIEAFAPKFEKESELRMSHQMVRQLWLESIMKCHLDFVSKDFCPCYFMPNFFIPVGSFLKDFHMRCFTDDDCYFPDKLFEAYRLYRSVSLHGSGFDFQLPPPNPVFEREAMIANPGASAFANLRNAPDIYAANETERVEAADDDDNDEDDDGDDDDDDDDDDNDDSGGSVSGGDDDIDGANVANETLQVEAGDDDGDDEGDDDEDADADDDDDDDDDDSGDYDDDDGAPDIHFANETEQVEGAEPEGRKGGILQVRKRKGAAVKYFARKKARKMIFKNV